MIPLLTPRATLNAYRSAASPAATILLEGLICANRPSLRPDTTGAGGIITQTYAWKTESGSGTGIIFRVHG
ncbi:MAG: hypothetical protein ABR517_03115 [Thermoanaerobaculia bacterium]